MKIETLALMVAVVGVGMALYYTKSGGGFSFSKTQYGSSWGGGPETIENLGASNGAIVYI